MKFLQLEKALNEWLKFGIEKKTPIDVNLLDKNPFFFFSFVEKLKLVEKYLKWMDGFKISK